VACSGSTADQADGGSTPYYFTNPPSSLSTYHGVAEGQFSEVAQVDSGVLSGDTTLVLVSAGGNDAHFPNVLEECAIPNCVPKESTYRGYIDAAQSRIRDLLTKIRSNALNATILLVGYPRIFANVSGCDFYSAQEAAMLNVLAQYMRDKQQQTVNGIGDAKIKYLDMVTGFGDHGACRNQNPPNPPGTVDINEVIIGATGDGDFRVLDGETSPACFFDWLFIELCVSRSSFHPKESGTTLYGTAVTNRLAAIGYQ